jgi:methionyl-tRNA formyltransferase
LHIPKIFSINLHASLLPKYRGAAPINWAVINGETKTGLTIIKMNEMIDAGEIVLKKSVDIDSSDTAVSLERKLAREGASLLLECLDGIDKKTFKLTPQDSAEVSLAPKLKKNDGLIDWNKGAQEVQNLIRGTFDWPGAFTYYKGKLLKIYKATVTQLPSYPVTQLPGEIMRVSKEGIVVATGKESLLIKELQMEGKRRMKVEEFIAGHKVLPQELLGKK